jgi:hypothetical protein
MIANCHQAFSTLQLLESTQADMCETRRSAGWTLDLGSCESATTFSENSTLQGGIEGGAGRETNDSSSSDAEFHRIDIANKYK